MADKESRMVKVCPDCHGVYERQNLICSTCKKQLVLRERRQTGDEPEDEIPGLKHVFIALLMLYTVIDLIEDPSKTGSWIKLAACSLYVIFIAGSGILSWRRKHKKQTSSPG